MVARVCDPLMEVSKALSEVRVLIHLSTIQNQHRPTCIGIALICAVIAVHVVSARVEVETIASQAPFPAPTFQRFTSDDGLAQDGVFCLLQDSKGFLWIGTWHGLSRFDGYQFVNYRHDFENPHSITDNKVNAIYETKSGELWLGTRNGLNLFDRATNRFSSFKLHNDNDDVLGDSYIQAVFEDREGTLWVGISKGGLSKLDRTTGRFTNYKNNPEDPASLSSNNVFGIGEDGNGNFWIATDGGLNKFDRKTGHFKRYQSDKQNPNSLSDNRIRSMFVDRAGIIWLGTVRGLNKFNPDSNQFTRYLRDKNNPNGLDDNSIFSIYEARSGALWVGTHSGLNRFIKETDSFVSYKHDPANPRSLSEGEVWSITEDNNNQLWVGSSVAGLNKFNQKTSRFTQFTHDNANPNSITRDSIRAILEDQHKNLWIGTKGGLYRYNSQQNSFEIFKDLYDNIRALYEERTGKIWIDTEKQLINFDPASDRLTVYPYDPDKPGPLGVGSFLEDRRGILWVATSNGELRLFDRTSAKFTLFQPDLKISGGASENRILAILEDSSGQIWIGTRGGLVRFDPTTQNFKHYKHEPGDARSLSTNDVGAIYQDKSGTLWFGTSSGGLNRFDQQTETFTHFTEREGLPIDNIYEILEDDQGNLWLSTDKGLSRFNIQTKRFRNFDVSDGLIYNEFEDKAAFKNRAGEMYFGGPRGFVRFNPKEFTDSQFSPPIYLTDVRVLELPLPNQQNTMELKELNLSWRDYVVSFEFAALDFTDPRKLQYQWKLEGFDRDWINGGTRRTATYTNLPGGSYVLKVKATNVDGLWTPESLLLSVNVTPPFYRTFWFLAIVALTTGVLVWVLYRYRINQLHKISEAQTRFTQQLIISQEAERKRIAAELHDGLGQSLVIIKNRAMLGIKKGDDQDRVARELNGISESATQGLEEVREITNNLRPQLLDRVGLTKTITAMLKKLSGVIEIESDIDAIDKMFSEIEEISIYRIVQESLNNIIKHSHASDAVVKIKRDENKVLITIEDNGQGFDVGNDKSYGAGLGLVGLKERVQLLGGKFDVDSKMGEGTKIRVEVQSYASRRGST